MPFAVVDGCKMLHNSSFDPMRHFVQDEFQSTNSEDKFKRIPYMSKNTHTKHILNTSYKHIENIFKMSREFGLLNLMNTPEHCSAPFHSVSSKLAKVAETAKMTKMTKMAAAHIQTYVLHVTWSILYTYLITPPESVQRHG